MHTILFQKMGAVSHSEETLHKAKPDRSITEERGVLKHLCERGDLQVIYFGSLSKGTVLPEGCVHVAPHLEDLNELSTAAHQEMLWALDIVSLLEVIKYEPIAFVQIAGLSPTFSWIRNPRGAQIQASGVRYSSPALNAMQILRLPRVVICNDTRSYPKDQEMSYGWAHCRPAALLDQMNSIKSQVVGGKQYMRHAVYAACESWNDFSSNEIVNTGEFPCVIMSHAHVDSNMRSLTWEFWREQLTGHDYPVIGNGWPEGVNDVSNIKCRFHPLTRFNNIPAVANQVMCSPVYAHTPGYLTNKPHKLMNYGCIPLFHVDYDPNGVYCDKYCRFSNGHELQVLVEELSTHRLLRDMLATVWQRVLKPRWGVLDELIDDLKSCPDIGSPEWLSMYGGYKPL